MPGDPGPGGDQPGHRHRRRQSRPRSGRSDHRPGRPVGHAQRDPPVHRHRRDDAAHDQVERTGPRPAHGRRGGAQGLRGGHRRKARGHPPRAAGRRHGEPRHRRALPAAHAAAGERTRRGGPAPHGRSDPRGAPARAARGPRGRAPGSRAGAARALPQDRAARDHHLHGQGRARRRRRALPVHRRPERAELPGRLFRARRPRDLRGLRHGRVGARRPGTRPAIGASSASTR